MTIQYNVIFLGIATGKSTVGRIFSEELNVPIIDNDLIARRGEFMTFYFYYLDYQLCRPLDKLHVIALLDVV